MSVGWKLKCLQFILIYKFKIWNLMKFEIGPHQSSAHLDEMCFVVITTLGRWTVSLLARPWLISAFEIVVLRLQTKCKEKNEFNWNFDSVDLNRWASSLSLTWSWFWFWFIFPMRPHWFRAATIAGLIGNGFIFIPVGEIRTNRKLLKLRKSI